MKFMLLMVGGTRPNPNLSQADFAKIMAQFDKVTGDLKAQGKYVDSNRLQAASEATTVRLAADGQRTVVDGPFTETKEFVGGYYLIECESKAEAIEWAKRFPMSVEVNGVFQMP
jgi:hypothetical protein